jgi:uncharacterized cupin superfamily protein
MEHCLDWVPGTRIGFALFAILLMNVHAVADEAGVVRAIKMDPDKLAGINLPAEEPFIDADDVLEGKHRPRGEVLYYGEQLILEVYEEDPATFRIDEPYLFDEFVMVLSGKLILTGTDGVSQAFVAGDSLVVPKGFRGTWQMLGNFREFVVIERRAYEKAYGVGTD